MKLLFLDCDGVINGMDWYAKHRAETIEMREKTGFFIVPECKARVKRIIKETECKVVWISSWRHIGSSMQEEKIRKTWEHIGFDPDDLYSWTPWLHVCGARSVEIEQWLDEHPEAVGKAVILDDGRSAYVPEDYKEGLKIKFINTSLKTGLTIEEMCEAIAWLNK